MVKMSNTLADRLRNQLQLTTATAPHVIVKARAGTGKTTTLVEGLKLVLGGHVRIEPSIQQQAIFDQLVLSRGVERIGFVAFSRAIAQTLKERIPESCVAMTLHGLGYRAVRQAFRYLELGEPDEKRNLGLLAKLKNWPIKKLLAKYPVETMAVDKLVDLCKVNLLGFNGTSLDVSEIADAALEGLAEDYDIPLGNVKSRDKVFASVRQVLLMSLDVEQDKSISFTDQIWLPVVLNLPVKQFDLLCVDESQDLNRCQHALVMKAGLRLILVGDDFQAIFGFTGADCNSISTIKKQLEQTHRGCIELPLTVTRRCGKEIVGLAKTLVSDFEAHDSNKPGKLTKGVYPIDSKGRERPGPHYTEQVQYGDMVICRCNAPLVSECFRFIGMGKKATIKGRDYGNTLIQLIRIIYKQEGSSCENEADWDNLFAKIDAVDFLDKLRGWEEFELKKEEAKSKPSERVLTVIRDKAQCLRAFTSSAGKLSKTVEGIRTLFSDTEEEGVKLSSIHRAKGLEAERVFLLQIAQAPCPHPMAKTKEARAQEKNLLYVAYTRAIEELCIVS